MGGDALYYSEAVLSSHSQAISLYRSECEKVGAGGKIDDEVVKRCTAVADLCEVTSYESHLVRSLRKAELADRSESIVKYNTLFAHLANDVVLAQLTEGAAAVLQSAPPKTSKKDSEKKEKAAAAAAAKKK